MILALRSEWTKLLALRGTRWSLFLTLGLTVLLTLLVTPDEAEKLTLASRQSAVRLALRNYNDQEIVKTGGISDTALFASDDRRATRTVRGSRVPEAPSIEILLGEKRTRQPLL